MHWVNRHERHCPLFTIDDRFPKPAAVGSNPTSPAPISINLAGFLPMLALAYRTKRTLKRAGNPVNKGNETSNAQSYTLAFLLA